MADKKQLSGKPKQESENLEDILSWLEELALDEPSLPAGVPAEVEFLDDDEGLSWLDQVSGGNDPLDEPPTLSWDQTRPLHDLLSPSLPLTSAEESEQDSMEAAINWLDELAAQPPAEPVAPPVARVPDPTPEPVSAPPPITPPVEIAPAPPKPPAKKAGGMFGAEEQFSITDEELAAAVAGGAKLEGFDMPDDDEAAMAWLEGLLGGDGDLFGEPTAAPTPEPIAEPEPVVEELDLESLMAEALQEEVVPEPPVVAKAPEPVPAPPVAPPAPPAKKAGGMFGAEEQFSITDEELAAAVAGGAKLEGFDMPDDDEAAMAWLEGLLGGDGDLFGEPTAVPAPEPIAEPIVEEVDLGFLMVEALLEEAPPAPPVVAKAPEPVPAPPVAPPTPPAKKAGGMFGAEEQFSITDEELAAAVAGGAKLEGFDMPDDDEAAMAWLEGLLGGDGDLFGEPTAVPTPEPIAEPEPELLLATAAEEEEEEGDGDLSWLDEMSEEEDEQGLIVADLGDFPDDPEEAMRLLELLAASQEMDEDELAPTELGGAFEEDWEEEAELATPASSGDLLADFGLDSLEDDALGWLDEVTDDSEDGLIVSELGDLPEDPDEAMAILERLSAAQNTADIDGDEDADDDFLALPDLDDWDAFDGLKETPADLAAVALEGELAAAAVAEASVVPDGDISDVQELFSDDVSSSLPDWLSMEPSGGGDFDPLAWLDADFGGGDSGVLGWLAAEEEVTKKGGVPKMDMDMPIVPPKATPATPERRKPTAVPTPESVSQAPVKPVYDPAIFQPARQLLSKGDVPTALQQYQQYLQQGQAPVLIDELEHVVSGLSRHPLLRRLLGDAYMQNGQLQEALDMYTIARDQL